MKALDTFLQGPACIALLAAIGLTSLLGAPPGGKLSQLAIWAGAFAFPLLMFGMRRFRVREGIFGRYPGFATAALFFVQACAVYRWDPGVIKPDTFVGTTGLYLLFAILTVA